MTAPPAAVADAVARLAARLRARAAAGQALDEHEALALRLDEQFPGGDVGVLSAFFLNLVRGGDRRAAKWGLGAGWFIKKHQHHCFTALWRRGRTGRGGADRRASEEALGCRDGLGDCRPMGPEVQALKHCGMRNWASGMRCPAALQQPLFPPDLR